MKRNFVAIVSMVAYLVGLPILGWYLSTFIIENPPIVAPFLFASPLYAVVIAGGVLSYGRSARIKTGSLAPIDELEPVLRGHSRIFKRYLGRIAFADGELDGSACLMGWNRALLDRNVWNRLTPSGREFMLVYFLGQRKSTWIGSLARQSVFLGAYMLACLNLWYVILLHVGGVAIAVMYAGRVGDEQRFVRDRRVLVETNNYRGAVEFIKATRKPSDNSNDRLGALKQSAVELGLA